MKRRKFTKEFKQEAVKLVTEQGYEVKEAADSLGIRDNMLSRWKKELSGEEPNQMSGSRKEKENPEEELRRLREENRRLRMEREILKKATAFFAKENN